VHTKYFYNTVFLQTIQQAIINRNAILTAKLSAAADDQQDTHLPATINKTGI
jgi:hypothetical protein